MKKHLLLLFLVYIVYTASGQYSIPNGSFESWNSGTFDYPQNYQYTSNSDQFFRYQLPFNEVKTTPGFHGAYSIQLTTNATASDTSIGYFLNTDPNSGNPFSWTGGMPYNQKPSGIRGYYKYNVANTDSATIIVVFSNAGTNIGTYMFKVGGLHTSFNLFNFSFSPALTVTPDAVIFAATSSDIMTYANGVAGSILIIDSVSFTGVSVQPALFNGDFELWETQTLFFPINWYFQGDAKGVDRTVDKVAGDYAIQLTTILGDNDGNPFARAGYISNSYWDNSCMCIKGGNSFSNQIDTLAFWYKYIPSGNDTASTNLNFKLEGANIGWAGVKLPASINYKYVEIPFNIGQAPDSVIVQIQSSLWYDTLISFVGSVLKIDEMHFKSQPLYTSITNYTNDNGIKILPNPSNGRFVIQSIENNIKSVEIYNITGEKVYSSMYFKQEISTEINLFNSPKGMYLVKIYDGQKFRIEKIVLQ